MILLDKPYISEFLKRTIIDNKLTVLKTDLVDEFSGNKRSYVLNEKQCIESIQNNEKDVRLYSNSENSIDWIIQHVPFTDIPRQIDLFKNKIKFRTLIKELYPEYYFRGIELKDLDSLDISEIPMPFIIKPAVGFFSMSVHRVDDATQWENVKNTIREEVATSKSLYPETVVDRSMFIIEEFIEGDEFAIDAYFDASGKAHIVGLFKHLFSSEADVSDRIYLTSKEIVSGNLAHFSTFVQEMGTRARLKNFPMHIEIRLDSKGNIIPIEINPMRFGGWCTTADLSFMAYGMNPYLSYIQDVPPDWESILSGMDDSLYSLIILDNSTGVPAHLIEKFDYDKVETILENVLELRQIDFRKYPLFAVVFAKTRPENYKELNYLLYNDLNEFITQKTKEKPL